MWTLFWVTATAQNVLDFTYSPKLFLKRGQLCATFYSETVLYIVSDEAFRKLRASVSRHDIYREGQIWRVRWPLFLLNHFRQFTCRHCWATRAVCTEPRASRWICRSVRQQSVAVFNQLFWKRKLINNFSYCLQNISTKITLQWHHCCVKLVLFLLK